MSRVLPSIKELSEDGFDLQELAATDETAPPTTAATVFDDRAHDPPAEIARVSSETAAGVVAMVQSSSEVDSIGSLDSISFNSVPIGAGSGLRATATLGMQQAKPQSTSEYVRGLHTILWQKFSGAEASPPE